MKSFQGTTRPTSSFDLERNPEFTPLVEAWRASNSADLDDLASSAFSDHLDDLVVVEELGDGHYVYLHYGASVSGDAGLDMAGKKTSDFVTDIGKYFAETYDTALRLNRTMYSVNKAAVTHLTHSWQRFVMPFPGNRNRPGRVVAFVRRLVWVDDILTDFARDTGFLGGSLEPVVEEDAIHDFAILSLTGTEEVLGTQVSYLSELYGRPLNASEASKILLAADGEIATAFELPRSVQRYGRRFVLQISGAKHQPIFMLNDATELLNARNEAEDQRETMSELANIASDWMWESDENHKFTSMTDAVEVVSGRSASSFIGKSRFDYAPLPDNHEAFEAHRKTLDTHEPFKEFVYQGRTPKGEVRWYRVNGAPRFSKSGAFLGYRGTGSDITAEVDARRLADKQKSAMEDFANTASDWMWETDASDVFTYVSKAIEEQTGSPPQRYLGVNWFDLEDVPENVDAFAAHRLVRQAHQPFQNLVYKGFRDDGTELWIRTNGVPCFDDDGKFAGYRGTGSNISEEIEARRTIEAQNEAMEDFAKTASDWMWESDAEHKMTMLTDAVTAHCGHPPSYFIGKSRLSFANLPENADVFAAHIQDIEAHRPFRDLVYLIQVADGSYCWFRVNGVPRFDPSGTFLGYRGTGSNITDEVEAREQAARRAEDLAEAHRLGRLGAWSYNRRLGTVTISPEFLELTGLPPSQTVMSGKRFAAFIATQDRAGVGKALRDLLVTKETQTIDIAWQRGSGATMDLSVIARARIDADGQIKEIVGTVQDISARKKFERELEELAFHDPLTRLGNRAYFSRELDTVLDLVKQGRMSAGLLLLDLDHFKEVNDTLGHAAGDELLRRVAERLSRTMMSDGMVFRLGGDEFAVLVPDVSEAAELSAHASNIISAFAGTVRLIEGSVHISTSIGMVTLPDQASDADEAMRFADLALYEAKSSGRNRSLLFHTGLDQEVQDRVSLARDLREAITNDQLEAHFQLQVDVMAGKITGLEALARWNHPTRGYIPPDKFIPIAESSRLIADLGAWMLLHACRQGKAWLDAGGAPLQMAVNLSVAQIWHRNVEQDVKDALKQSGFPPELLCVELTESVFSDDALPRIQRLFANLKELGVKIALDDFGTGYSSLQYLNTLSVDKLKIDRSFVADCDQNPEQLRLLQGIVGLCRGLGLGVVVEGIEREAELQVVCDLGCEEVQGYFFSYPKPFHEACLDAAQVEADYGFASVLWKGQARDESASGDQAVQPVKRAG
ncbi:MAG: EAL domain-containing protein [Devosiaceae bacterium]